MCCFYEYAKPEWGDDVTITSHFASPLQFWCHNCSLHPEGKGHYHTIRYTRENAPKKFSSATITGSPDEIGIAQIIAHIREHKEAGHTIHPMVEDILFERMKEYMYLYRTTERK